MSEAPAPETDSLEVRSVKEVLSALAVAIVTRVHEHAPDLDEPVVTALVDNALNDIVGLGTGKLSRGEVFGLFAGLGRLVGIPEPAISGPFTGTHRVLIDEFAFNAFTPRGTAVFRHRKTGRDLYIAIQGGDILIGMYDPGVDNLAAFVRTEDALAWARGTGQRNPKRKTNISWYLP